MLSRHVLVQHSIGLVDDRPSRGQGEGEGSRGACVRISGHARALGLGMEMVEVMDLNLCTAVVHKPFSTPQRDGARGDVTISLQKGGGQGAGEMGTGGRLDHDS